MKKLILTISIIAVAILSTFPVKDTMAIPQTCTKPIVEPDGSATKICYENGVFSKWYRPCAYCPWELEHSQPF